MTKTYQKFGVDVIHGKILKLPHEKGRTGHADLAERIHLSEPHILHRTRSLEEQGRSPIYRPGFTWSPQPWRRGIYRFDPGS
jgi:hypothetical protein